MKENIIKEKLANFYSSYRKFGIVPKLEKAKRKRKCTWSDGVIEPDELCISFTQLSDKWKSKRSMKLDFAIDSIDELMFEAEELRNSLCKLLEKEEN